MISLRWAMTIMVITAIFMQTMQFDNSSPMILSSNPQLSIIPVPYTESVHDEGVAIYDMIQAIPQLAFMKGPFRVNHAVLTDFILQRLLLY